MRYIFRLLLRELQHVDIDMQQIGGLIRIKLTYRDQLVKRWAFNIHTPT